MATPDTPSTEGLNRAGRRRLVRQENRSSASGGCIACRWRKFSNDSFRQFRKQQEESGVEFPAQFSGIVPGYVEGHIILAQMVNNRQVGFISIPLQYYDAVMRDANGVYSNVVQQISAELAASQQAAVEAAAGEPDLDEPETAPEAGEEGEA